MIPGKLARVADVRGMALNSLCGSTRKHQTVPTCSASLAPLVPAARSDPLSFHAANYTSGLGSTGLRYTGKLAGLLSHSRSSRDVKANYTRGSQDVPLLTSRLGFAQTLGLANGSEGKSRLVDRYSSMKLDCYQVFGVDDGLAEAKALQLDPGLALHKYSANLHDVQSIIQRATAAKMTAVDQFLNHRKTPGSRDMVASLVMSQNLQVKNFKTEEGMQQLFCHAEDVFDSGCSFLMLQEAQHYTARLQCIMLNQLMPGRDWRVVMPESQRNQSGMNLAILYDAKEYECLEEKHHMELRHAYEFLRCPISATFEKLKSDAFGDAGQLMTLINLHNKVVQKPGSREQNWQNLEGVISLLHQSTNLTLAVGDYNAQVFPGKSGHKARVAADIVRRKGIAACVHGATNSKWIQSSGSMSGAVQAGDAVYDGALIVPQNRGEISKRLEAKACLRPSSHLFGTQLTTVSGSDHQGLFIPCKTVQIASH